MSMDSWDDYYSSLAEQEWDHAFEEFRENMLQEFQEHLLRGYYLAHLDLPKRPLDLVRDARATRLTSPAATVALACGSIELSLRELILRPLVHGVIHQGAVAHLVADLTLGHNALDRFKGLLFGVLLNFVGIDLHTYTRPDSEVTHWQEIRDLQAIRNSALHRGELPPTSDANRAIVVAEYVLNVVCGNTLAKFGFKVDETGRIQPPPPLVSRGPVV